MKKYLSIFLLAVLFVFGTNNANAQTGSSTDSKDSTATTTQKSEVKKVLTKAQQKIEEAKTKLEEAKNQILKGFGDRVNQIGTGIDTAMAQLQEKQDRITAIITKLQTAGKDVTSANEHLDLSKKSFADAKVSVEAAKAIIVSIDQTKITDKNYIKGIKDSFKAKVDEAKNSLNESRSQLKETIKAINDLRQAQKENNTQNSSNQ